MPRFVALLLLAACAGRSPPVANHATLTTYTITPVDIRGGEGLHSMSHSSTTVTGRLDVRGDRADLALDLATFTGFVHCNFDGVETLQACAPPELRDQHTRVHVDLAGTVTRGTDGMAFALRDHDRHATLTCRTTGAKLACALDDGYTLFGPTADGVQLELVRQGA